MNDDSRSGHQAPFRWIDADEAETLATELLSPDRAHPVVAVTTHPSYGRPIIDPVEVAGAVGDCAEVVALETGDATWALSEALPSRLDVYGGAARIWWPGLSRSSDPYDHPLLFARTERQAAALIRRIADAVRNGAASSQRSGTARADKSAPGQSSTRGRARPATDRTRAARRRTDPWQRLREVYDVGDVVRGRICRIEKKFVLVEVLPGVALLAPLAELDWTFVKDPADLFSLGVRVNAKILELDDDARRGTVSIKRAYAVDTLPAVAPEPGMPLFLDDDDEAEPDAKSDDDAAERVKQLTEELDSALADRSELMRRLKAARKDLRSAEDRLRTLESRATGDLDPVASETAFLTAVRVEYARRFNEADRHRYPLQRMRVGREFLDRLRELQGVSVEKVVEVCAQVACLRAHKIAAREVHELRSGPAGAPARTRDSDGAKAWRCSLQDGTPSARRLHWWDIPGKKGRTIEFASVAVHDDYSIPE